MSIGLLGFKTQSMAGRTANKVPRALFTAFNPGDTSWTCPATGYYTFTIRGPGGYDLAGGASGAAAQVTRLLFTGQVVSFVIGRGQGLTGATGANSVLTMPSGLVVTAGAAAGATPGTATGGDTNVSGAGSPGGNVGGNAPAIGSFPAVAATPAGNATTPGPGAGGGSNGGGPPANAGGPGILFVKYGKA